MQYPDDLHPDDVAALSNQLDLPELDSIFWSIFDFPFTCDLPQLSEINEMEFAKLIIEKISFCKNIFVQQGHEPEEIEYFFPETSIIKSLNSCFCDYETFQIITETFPTLPKIAYYKVILNFQLYLILYEYYFHGKNENVLLRNLIRLYDDFHFSSNTWSEIQYNNHHDSIKEARSIIGSRAAYKRHFLMRRRKADAIALYMELNANPDTAISKNKFSEDYAKKYTVTQKTLREWLKGDLRHPYDL